MSDGLTKQLTSQRRRNLKIKWFFLWISLILIAVISITFIFKQYKHITVEVDGEKYSIGTFSKTYEDVLNNHDIVVNSYDKVSIDLKSEIKDKTNLIINRAVPATISCDGKIANVYSADETIGQLLNRQNITLRQYDVVNPLLDEKVTEDVKIEITRIDKKIETSSEEVAFKTTEKEDASLTIGEESIVQEGQNGKKEIKFEVTLKEGNEVHRKVISDKVVEEPIEKIIAKGTKEKPKPILNTNTQNNVVQLSELQSNNNIMMCVATAYSPYDGGSYYDITASGAVATRNPSGYSTIAVDPTVIPLGTKVYVKGYGYAIAQDTGGLIKGSKIDVFFDTPQECINWGIKTVEVTILD